MDLGGSDITSVNTRTPTTPSASPTSSCGRSRKELQFGLRARKTGEVIETVDARELFPKISEAAWECADPGLQYDDQRLAHQPRDRPDHRV